MKHKQFKITVILLFFIGFLSAQKTNKKFNEKFHTNKDVAIEINASNAEIDVETWSKNEVVVEATIEIDGISKKEAEKYLNNWKFEALGNKGKVKINANANNFHSFGRNSFVHFNSDENHFPIVIPEMPEIPDMSSFEFPEIDEDVIILSDDHLEHAFKDIEDIEFDFDKYEKEGGDYFIQWKDGVNDVTIKSKEDWEKFKKTKKYKEFKKSLEKSKVSILKSKETLRKSRETLKKSKKARSEARKKMKEAYAKARKQLKKIDRTEMNRALAEAQKNINNSNFRYLFSSDSNNLMIDGKKVKITKKIKIKVPKGTTFNLNTRHCKVKLPGSKVSGKVSYGTFNANSLNGGNLNISYSPVLIEQLTACTLFLNNVTDAKIASVTNSNVNANSSKVVVTNINGTVDFSNKFGELRIDNISKNLESLKLLLNYTDAKINLTNLRSKLSYDIGKKSPFYPNKSAMKYAPSNSEKEINGDFAIVSEDKKLNITGKYSQLVIKE